MLDQVKIHKPQTVSSCFTDYILCFQVYPTTVRALGVGVCSSSARIGEVITPFVSVVSIFISRLTLWFVSRACIEVWFNYSATRSFASAVYATAYPSGWLRSTVVERRSLAGELSLSCARPAADELPLMWVNRPL